MKSYARTLAIVAALAFLGFFATVGLMSVLFAPTSDNFAPRTGADAASWVQAIGSILAILGAFYVGHVQAASARNLADEMENLRIRRHIAGMRIVVNRLLLGSKIAYQSVEEQEDVVKFGYTWEPITLPSLQSALRAFETLPVYEFGSFSRMLVAQDIEDFARKLMRDVNTMSDIDPDPATSFRVFRATSLPGYRESLEKLQKDFDKKWPPDFAAWAPYNNATGI